MIGFPVNDKHINLILAELRLNMQIDLNTGWLDVARQCPSPNHEERAQPADLSLIVIHNISLPPGEFGGGWIDDLFTNQLDAQAHPFLPTSVTCGWPVIC
ncbi:MAG: hypothetical protein R3E89_00990 [Thiolinea sp.]